MDYSVYTNEELAAAANSGNEEAKVQLGRRFLFGLNGAEIDPYTAKKWFEDAYDCGSIAAARYLGIMYLGDDGIVADLPKAISFLTAASDAGDGAATFYLASAYMNGQGVKEDPLKAIDLFQTAADAKHLAAEYFMAEVARSGQLGEKDCAKAIRYLEASIAHETDADLTDNDKSIIAMAYDTLGDIYKNGEYGPVDLAKAAKMYEKGADFGNAWAQFELGTMYQNGNGIEQNKEKAFYWFQMSAMGGNQSAVAMLGAICALDEGNSEQDVAEARRYLKMAADNGNAIAQTLLGSLLLKDGHIEEALSLLETPAQNNSPDALFSLAHYYVFMAEDTAENAEKAAYYAERAAATGEKPDAKCLIAIMYLKGSYYPRDKKKAFDLIREATEEGSTLASSEEFRNAMASIKDLKVKLSRNDYLKTDDMNQDVDYIRALIQDENCVSRNPDADALIKNALTFEKLGNREKLCECYTSINNTYPDDLRGWLGMLLLKSEDFSLYFAPSNIERYYEERQLMNYALTLTTDDSIKQKLGEIFVKYEDNLGAVINDRYLKLATELKSSGHILDNSRFDELQSKYGLVDKYSDALIAKHPELQQRIPIITEGLYGLMNYVFFHGIGVKLFAYQMVELVNQKEQEQKEELKRRTRQSLIQEGNTMTDSMFEESFAKTYPNSSVHKEFENMRNEVKKSWGDINPNSNIETTACASQLLQYAGTDDDFIEMLLFICQRNGIRHYDFLENYLSAKAKAEKTEAIKQANDAKKQQPANTSNPAKTSPKNAEKETATNDASDKPKNKILTALSYVSILFLIPAFLDKESKFTRHHVNQGGTLFLISLLKTIIFDWILGATFLYIIGWLVSLACVAFSIIGIYRVFTDSQDELPLIGNLRIVEKLLERFQ